MLNTKYLQGETGEQHRDRLRKEMNAEVAEHKRAIGKVLTDGGHKVKLPEDLEQDYLGQTWVIDGESIEVKSKYQTTGSYHYSEPTGGLRITVGPYSRRRVFNKKTAKKELAKHPSGFDYAEIAKELLDIAKFQRDQREQTRQAYEQAEANDAICLPAAKRLAKEFEFKQFYGTDSYIGTPLKVERGHAELGLEFRGLSEDQARAILAAAKACGALKE